MTPENIIQLISLLLGGGGLIALFLITERKTKAQMENTAQAIAEWQKIVEHSHHDLNGACWFGLDEGLAHFNPNGAESAFISQEQNIGDVYDYALWNNTLYLGTNKGLYRIDEDKQAHLVTGTSGIAWNIVNCKDFLAVEIDENLYVIYPDNTYDNILSGICHLTKWAYSNNLRPVEKYHYDIFHRNGAKLHYKDISSNFSAHIMTMQAENILKNTYAKR